MERIELTKVTVLKAISTSGSSYGSIVDVLGKGRTILREQITNRRSELDAIISELVELRLVKVDRSKGEVYTKASRALETLKALS